MFHSKLNGVVKRVVEHLDVYGEKFDRVRELLNRRYNNRRALVEKEIHTFEDLPSITQKVPSTLGKALDTMRSVNQN